MVKISKFTLNDNNLTLKIEFFSSSSINEISKLNNDLSYEFFRVFSPAENHQQQGKPIVAHKKNVKLLSIESVAKHGYRFIFDDEHSAIYDEDYLEGICQDATVLWQQYLEALSASGHSREAMINITQL